jgi:hypothetical protein
MSIYRWPSQDISPAHYLELLGKSHVVVIEHEDSQQGFANLVAALKGKPVKIQVEDGVEVVGDPQGATGKELAQIVDGVMTHGGKGQPLPMDEIIKYTGPCFLPFAASLLTIDGFLLFLSAQGAFAFGCCFLPVHWWQAKRYSAADDNQHERNGLFSMVTKADEWLEGHAHIRLRKATIGQPDYLWTPGCDEVKETFLFIGDPHFVCPKVNFKPFGCYECSGQVKNSHIVDHPVKAEEEPSTTQEI